MPSVIEYYQVLQLTKSSSANDIKQSYRKFALQYHPQKAQDSESQVMFHEVSEAYDVLSDAKKKAVYDLYGHQGLSQGVDAPEAAYEGKYSFGAEQALKVFEQFFGTDNVYEAIFAPGPDTRLKTKDYHSEKDAPNRAVIKAALEELYTGIVKPVSFKKNSYDLDGKVIEQEDKQFQVKIKPGWKTGTKVVFPKEGHNLPSGLRDDAVFIIEEQKHEEFKREGHNLHVTKNVPLRNALTSTSITIKTLDHRQLSVQISDVISPNYIKIVSGEGMPKPSVSGIVEEKGDLYIHFKIDFPKYLSEKQKKLINEAFNMSS